MTDFADRFGWEDGRVPSVNPEHLAAMWKFIGGTDESVSNTKTTGLGVVLARAGFSAHEIETLSRVEGGGFALVVRSLLLQSLFQRGVLQAQATGTAADESVVRAAASFPFTEADLAEATVLLQLKNLPPEKSFQLRTSLVEQGYDPEEPKVDVKFLKWIVDANV